MDNYYKSYFKSIYDTLENSVYSEVGTVLSVDDFFSRILLITKKVMESKGRIFFVGNGASAAIANHMALDWSKNGGILSSSLSDSAYLTALSNDYDYSSVFTEYFKINNVNNNDFVVTISSSGNSGNIVSALEYCNSEGINTLALSGLKPKNRSMELAKYSIYVPRKTYGIVECTHQIFLHMWLDRYMEIFEWKRDTFQNMDSNNFKL